jgi:hypothetical protein
MLQSGVQLLDRFAQDDRVRIRQPRRNLQIKYTKVLAGQNYICNRAQRWLTERGECAQQYCDHAAGFRIAL